MEVKRFWILFRAYLITAVIVFAIGTIFYSWICIFPATAGTITCFLWYKEVKKKLKQLGHIPNHGESLKE